jgi:hypothetical protein
MFTTRMADAANLQAVQRGGNGALPREVDAHAVVHPLDPCELWIYAARDLTLIALSVIGLQSTVKPIERQAGQARLSFRTDPAGPPGW